MKEYKRYFSYIGKYKFLYWSMLTASIVIPVFINLMYSYMNKQVFNSVEYGDIEQFKYAVVLCAVLVVISCVFPYVRYFHIKVVRKIVFDIKIRVFHKLVSMNMEYYEKHHSGEALKTLNGDANSLKDSYFSHVYWVTNKLVGGVAAIVAMLIYSPLLAVISIAFSIVTVQISVRVNRKLKSMEKGIQANICRLSERLSDILSGFVILKMYRGSSVVLDDYFRENERVMSAEKVRSAKSASLEMVSFLMGVLGNFGTIIVGAVLVARGRMDYGTVMAVVSLQMSVSGMVQRFGSSMTTLTSSLVKAGRVFDFLELEGEEKIAVTGNADKAGNCKLSGGIKVRSLYFSYDGENDVISNFNLDVGDNEKVLLVGESGCGKSTLIKLLLRFYERKSGDILIYGRSISEYSLEELRELITYVPQNNYLFEGTIMENIAFGAGDSLNVESGAAAGNRGKAGADDLTEPVRENIVRAAKMAYADEFIRELPMGYDTQVSAGGSSLSGGQRQRIAIARAFLKDAPILLLDEPSSALDVRSEKMINLAMKQLMKNKIVIMVTHRTTSFEEFDRAVRLE